MRLASAVILLALTLALASCEGEDDRPYLAFAGGGFIFNYRIGEAFYGFVARPERALPADAVIEARFEVPGAEEPFVTSQPARTGMLRYSFKTPPLRGIVRGHRYRVELRVIEEGTGKVLATYENSYYTDVDQKTLPDKPLVLGPGYRRNPAVDLNLLPAE
jgi:hypothetical protein